MGQKKHPFDRVLSARASTGSNDLQMDEIKSGRLYCIQRVSVENETSAATDVRLMKGGPGGEFLLEEKDTLSAATLYWTSEAFYLTEGQYLLARFSGCTADDVLKVYITGWWKEGYEVD